MALAYVTVFSHSFHSISLTLRQYSQVMRRRKRRRRRRRRKEVKKGEGGGENR